MRLTRLRAFELRGVVLNDASESWGGVRAADGVVVFALWAGDVLSDAQGSSCLLWALRGRSAHGCTDGVSRQERLQHCRLAVLHGSAEGLLVYGDTAAVDPQDVLALRVARRGEEYWAKWGSVTRVAGSRAPEAPTAFLRRACGF